MQHDKGFSTRNLQPGLYSSRTGSRSRKECPKHAVEIEGMLAALLRAGTNKNAAALGLRRVRLRWLRGQDLNRL